MGQRRSENKKSAFSRRRLFPICGTKLQICEKSKNRNI